MKAIKLLPVTLAILMINSVYAVQYKFVAMDDSKYTKMCVLAGNNDITALKKVMKYPLVVKGHNRNSMKSLANNVTCNKLHLANFARNYNANMTFDYLKKYTSKRNLDKVPYVTIKDIAALSNENKSADEVIVIYVGH